MNVFSFRVLSLLLAAGFLFLCDAGDSFVLAQGAQQSSLGESQEGALLLAQSERKKHSRSPKERRKKKAPVQQGDSSAPAEAPADAVAAPSIHAAHEGKDEPYSWHVELLSSLMRFDQQPEGGDKIGSGYYSFDLKLLKVIASSIEVGPILSWSDSTTKIKGSDPSKSQSLTAGLRLGYNIGNLDKDLLLPFIWVGFGIINEKEESGNTTSATSGTGFGVGAGLHYFVDSNVALTGEFSLASDSLTTKVKIGEGTEVESKAKRTVLDFLSLGFSLFI